MMAKVNIVFDASKYDLFLLCEARYNFRHNLNIGLPGKAPQLDRGSVVHAGLEVYYEAIKNRVLYHDAVNMALSKIREAGVIYSDLDNDEINRIIDVAEEYFDYWRVADQGFEIVEVEKPFMYPLFENDDIRIFMSGKIDLVVSDNRYSNEPWDHKSYDRSYNVGRLNNQFRNYCTALQSYYLTVNKIGFQKTLKPHEKFIRTRLTYDPLILKEWKENVTNVLMNKYLECVAHNIWPMNETSCEKYNRKCEFYDICDSSGLPAKNYKINQNYILLEPWDVTKAMRKSSQIIEDQKKAREQADNGETSTRTQTEET